MGAPSHAQGKLDAYGLDAVCESIIAGGTLTFVAADAGVSLTSLLTWIEAIPERSARVREARAATGRLWDEKAETEIREAADEFGLKKAKELAHHYRWRASKIAAREYGDAVTLKGDKENPIQVSRAADLTDDELASLALRKEPASG